MRRTSFLLAVGVAATVTTSCTQTAARDTRVAEQATAPTTAVAAAPAAVPDAPSVKPRPLPQTISEQPGKSDPLAFNACAWRQWAQGQGADTAPATTGCTPPARMATRDLKVGEGKVVESKRAIMVHYTGWLFDGSKPDGRGTQFDSSRERPLGFSFIVGAGRVIKGWDEGVVGMREGGRRVLVIPPNMAYGDRVGGPIPPGSTLIFDVEVIRVLQ